MSFRRRASNAISDDLYLTFKTNFPRGTFTKTDVLATPAGTLTDNKTMSNQARIPKPDPTNADYQDYVNDQYGGTPTDGLPPDWAQSIEEHQPGIYGQSFVPNELTPMRSSSHDLPRYSGGFGHSDMLVRQHQTPDLMSHAMNPQDMHWNSSMDYMSMMNQPALAMYSTHQLQDQQVQLTHSSKLVEPNFEILEQYSKQGSESQNLPSHDPDHPYLQYGPDGSLLPLPEGGEEFRFYTVLHAKTNIQNLKNPLEAYLNKAHPYRITIRDLERRQPHGSEGLLYRTYFRITFEHPEFRENPEEKWRTWKRNRGTRKVGGRQVDIKAVEFVRPSEEEEVSVRNATVDLHSEQFDGFCVDWRSDALEPECEIFARFNFLSTDFSATKGIQGFVLRLCAKTIVVEDGGVDLDGQGFSQLNYCRVKSFRDHGSERKHNNDAKIVDKYTSKLKHAKGDQHGASSSKSRKRSRSESFHTETIVQRPTKALKTRTGSMSSDRSSGRKSLGDNLSASIQESEARKSSQRLTSIFFFPGEHGDDPEACPLDFEAVREPAKNQVPPPENKSESGDHQPGMSRHPPALPSERSHTSSQHHGSPYGQDPSLVYPSPAQFSRMSSGEVLNNQTPPQQTTPSTQLSNTNPQHLASPSNAPSHHHHQQQQQLQQQQQQQQQQRQQPLTHSTGLSDSKERSTEVTGTWRNYMPPIPVEELIACFFVQFRNTGGKSIRMDCFHAIYLRERSLQDFIRAIAEKLEIDAKQISEVMRIPKQKLDAEILVDDDVVLHLSEGQFMQAELVQMAVESGRQDSYDDDNDEETEAEDDYDNGEEEEEESLLSPNPKLAYRLSLTW